MLTLIIYPGSIMNKGILYLIPAPLGACPLEQVMPAWNIEILQRLDHFIVEELKTARRFLKKAGVAKDLHDDMFMIFNEHHQDEDLSTYLKYIIEGSDTGMLSEAGLPCIADPGNRIVALAHQAGVKVIPLTGPSSLYLALMASGFNGQNFTFHGYLPVDKGSRVSKIRELEKVSREKDQTQLFIETPYRNLQLLQSLTDICRDETQLCVAVDLSLEREWIKTKTIKEWKKIKPDLNKHPAVFLLYSGSL